jgi:hypothetical protein
MTWEEIEQNWPRVSDRVAAQWSRLTPDDIARIEGRREELIDCLRVRYQLPRPQAEREIEAWSSLTRLQAFA